MPEVILPCPECGKSRFAVFIQGLNGKWQGHCGCGHATRYCKTRESAIAAWNSLPRALRWTHKQPKVSDKMYLAKGMNLIVFLVATVEVNGTLYAQLPDSAENFPLSDFVEWAGPIAPPIE